MKSAITLIRRQFPNRRSPPKRDGVLRSIIAFWKSFDDSDGLERTIKFDACDREQVSRDLAKHINATVGVKL